MILKKFTRDYTRRKFIKNLGIAGVSMGVLSPLWSVLAEDGDHTRAYPEELLSLDAYTGGKISDTGTIDANNVDFVRDLLNPISSGQRVGPRAQRNATDNRLVSS